MTKTLSTEKIKKTGLNKAINQQNKKTYNNGKWAIKEHRAFVIGVLIYGSYWKGVQKLVKTRTLRQTMSHAQKFLHKINKICFSDSNTFTAKKLRTHSRYFNEDDIIHFIDKLTRMYFKKHEILLFTLNDKNNKNFSNNNTCFNLDDISDISLFRMDFNNIGNSNLRKNSHKEFLKNLHNINVNNDSLYCIKAFKENSSYFNKNLYSNGVVNSTLNYNKFTNFNNDQNLKIIKNKEINHNVDNNYHHKSNSNFNCESNHVYLQKYLEFCDKGIFENQNSENIEYNQDDYLLNNGKSIHHENSYYKHSQNNEKILNSSNSNPFPLLTYKRQESFYIQAHEYSFSLDSLKSKVCSTNYTTSLEISDSLYNEEICFNNETFLTSEIIIGKTPNNKLFIQNKEKIYKDNELKKNTSYDQISDPYIFIEESIHNNSISNYNDETISDSSFLEF